MSDVKVKVCGGKIDPKTHIMICEDVNFFKKKNYTLTDIAIIISERYGFNIKAEGDIISIL